MASDTTTASEPRFIGRFALALACLVLFVVLVRSAWVGEDALISMRTVDHFVNGRGLRWNIDDRVQTFTHPLWVFVLSAAYSFTREIYFTVATVCVCFSLAAFVVLLRRRSPVCILFVLIAVCLSESLVNFGTSGFENPLTNFLLSVFAVMFLQHDRNRVPWLPLSLTAALCATNRLDTVVIFGPAFALLLWRSWPRVPWKPLLLGSLPLVAWLSFSLLYYGFVVPNPAPAKVNSFMPLEWYLHFGVRDFVGLYYKDLGSGVLVSLGLVCAALSITRFLRDRSDHRNACLAALGAGLVFYCLCVIRVGGDFIIGRYWISPMWLSLVLVTFHFDRAWEWWIAKGLAQRLAVAAATIAVGFGLYQGGQALGQRMYSKASPGILRSLAHKYLKPDFTWEITQAGLYFRRIGEEARRVHEESGKRAFPVSVIGFSGIAAGPDVILVDILGLGDPLLARLPPMRRDYENVGHLERKLPVGYVKARETGSLDEMEPPMRAYYEKMRLVTSGPLWSSERMKAIVELNLGLVSPPTQYD